MTLTTTSPTTADIDAAVAAALLPPWREAVQIFLREIELKRQLAARRALLPPSQSKPRPADAPPIGRPRLPDDQLKRPRRAKP